MAHTIKCGEAELNERDALARLSRAFPTEWAVLTNIPRHVVKREIDACLVGPRGVIVLELKYYRGPVAARLMGAWDGIQGDDKDKNPLEQAEKGAQSLKSFLAAKDPSLARGLYVDSVVVLTYPDCMLTLADEGLGDRVGVLDHVVELVERRLQSRPGANRLLEFGTLKKILSALSLVPSRELLSSWAETRSLAAAIGARLPEPQRDYPRSNFKSGSSTRSSSDHNVYSFPVSRLPAHQAPSHASSMEPTTAYSDIDVTPHSIVGSKSSTTRILLAIIALCIVGFLLFRLIPRNGWPASVPVTTQFAVPQTFVVTPGRALHARERRGPGLNFPVTRLVVRGTVVVASGSTRDGAGAEWIALADGSGFLKMTTLRPVGGVRKTYTQHHRSR